MILQKIGLGAVICLTALAAHAQTGKGAGEELIKATARQGVRGAATVTARESARKAAALAGTSILDEQFVQKAAEGSRAVLLDPKTNFKRGYEKSAAELLDAYRMDEKVLPALARENNKRWVREYARFAADLQYVKKNAAQIAAATEVHAYADRVPYQDFVPEESRLIFIGETHNRKNIPDQIFSFIDAYRAKYPQRKVIVLTEFLPDSGTLHGGAGEGSGYGLRSLLLSEDFILLGKKDATARALSGIMERDLPLDGLEGLDGIVTLAEREGINVGEKDFRGAFGSYWGMRERNLIWAEHIRRTRQQNPQAVIMVYAGAGHVGYDRPDNLAELLQEPNPFVVEIMTHWSTEVTQPLSAYVRPFENRQAWNAARFQRQTLVRQLKDAQYRRYIGADLSVVVPGAWIPPMWPTKKELK